MTAPAVLLSLIVAVADNGVIGRGGQMPWRISSDLKRFRALTMGKPMIMGRKQYESVGRPLDGRDNIVLSRRPGFAAPGIDVVTTFEAALSLARERAGQRGADEIMVIGGGEIYNLAMPVANRLYLTRVHARPDGDVLFPEPEAADLRELEHDEPPQGAKDDYRVTNLTLERRR